MSSIAQAASVLLARGSGLDELFMVRRSLALRFFGGFWAFPGGKVHDDDARLPILPGRPEAKPGRSATHSQVVAAARELFEETGILLARLSDGKFPPSNPELERHRRELVAGTLAFEQVLKVLGASISESDFTFLGSLVTPAFAPIRFDTAFFLAEAPPNQNAEVWSGELDAGQWAAPGATLEQWHHGEALLSPPTLVMLQALTARDRSDFGRALTSLFQAHQAQRLPTIFVSPGIQVIPLKTIALPPSTHTNAYLVGTGPSYLLDPGPKDPLELADLFSHMEAHQAAGRALTAIILTHHHPDHVNGAAVCAARFGLEIWAHPLTAAALDGKIRIDREIHDADRLDLGRCPDEKSPSWDLEAIHTPGHASGHLAFYDRRYRVLLAGDMVSTQSSIVIAPPDGDLAVYLASLARLRLLPCRLLLPSHGSATANPQQTIDECIAHRQKREELLLEALRPGARGIDELSLELYRGVPEQLMKFAKWQVMAGLRKLENEGRVAMNAGNGVPTWELGDAIQHRPFDDSK